MTKRPLNPKVREELINDIKSFVSKYGRVPTQGDLELPGNGLRSLNIYTRYFDKWSLAIKAAGFEVTKSGKKLGSKQFKRS